MLSKIENICLFVYTSLNDRPGPCVQNVIMIFFLKKFIIQFCSEMFNLSFLRKTYFCFYIRNNNVATLNCLQLSVQ